MKKTIIKAVSILLSLVLMLSLLSVVGYAVNDYSINVYNSATYTDIKIKVGDAQPVSEFTDLTANSGDTVTLYIKEKENCIFNDIVIYARRDDCLINEQTYIVNDDDSYSFVMPDSFVEIAVSSKGKQATGVFGDMLTKEINVLSGKFGLVPYEVEQSLESFISDDKNSGLSFEEIYNTFSAVDSASATFNINDYKNELNIAAAFAVLGLQDILEDEDANFILSDLTDDILGIIGSVTNINTEADSFDKVCKFCDIYCLYYYLYTEGTKSVSVTETVNLLKNAKENPNYVPVAQGKTIAEKIAPDVVGVMREMGFDNITEKMVTDNYSAMVQSFAASDSSSECFNAFMLGEPVFLSFESLNDLSLWDGLLQKLIENCDTDDEMRDLIIKIFCYYSTNIYVELFTDEDVFSGYSDKKSRNFRVYYLYKVIGFNNTQLDYLRVNIQDYRDNKNGLIDMIKKYYLYEALFVMTYQLGDVQIGVSPIKARYSYLSNVDFGVVTEKTKFERYKAEKTELINQSDYSDRIKEKIIKNINALEYDNTITLEENKQNVDRLIVVENTQADEIDVWFDLLMRLLELVMNLIFCFV